MAEVAAHQHNPIVVYDDLREDEHGRPAVWLYHIECYDCGQVLDDDPAQAGKP